VSYFLFSNMGGKSPPPGATGPRTRTKIDWLAYSARCPITRAIEAVGAALEPVGRLEVKQLPKGRQGFERQSQLLMGGAALGVVMWGGDM
jgi:hypothetical protein